MGIFTYAGELGMTIAKSPLQRQIFRSALKGKITAGDEGRD